jgi:Zn-dependent protease with chaperone function
MEKQRDRPAGTTGDGKAGAPSDASRTLDYLSTHPATAERIQRARDYR